MKPFPKTLRAFDRHLVEQNNRRNGILKGRTAPVAPMPEDPAKCRWCSGKLIALIEFEEADYCQNGCAKNDTAPFGGTCDECRREFQTGKRHALLCHDCEQRLNAAVQERVDVEQQQGTRYQYERFKRGGTR